MLSKDGMVLRMSDVEVAYQILREKAQPMYFRELIDSVLELKPKDGGDPIQMVADVYTQMNLDTRFIHLGKGQWGLKNWVSVRTSRRIPSISLLNKSIEYDDSKDLDDDYGRDDWEDQ